MRLTLKTRNDEKDGVGAAGDPTRRTGCERRNRDHYVILNQYWFAEMVSVEQQRCLDEGWEERSQLANRTVKTCVRSQRYNQHSFPGLRGGELGRRWPGSAKDGLDIDGKRYDCNAPCMKARDRSTSFPASA